LSENVQKIQITMLYLYWLENSFNLLLKERRI